MKPKTISDLYYGNITPCDVTCYKTKKLEKISQKQLDLLIQLENKLGTNINLLDEYLRLLNEEYQELQLIAFQDGFSLGLKVTYESLQLKTKNEFIKI